LYQYNERKSGNLKGDIMAIEMTPREQLPNFISYEAATWRDLSGNRRKQYFAQPTQIGYEIIDTYNDANQRASGVGVFATEAAAREWMRLNRAP
jgi:hypothetical protein